MYLTGKKIKCLKGSAVFDHIGNTGHNGSFDNFETNAKVCAEFRLLLIVSLLILRDDRLLNRYVKFTPLELALWLSTS